MQQRLQAEANLHFLAGYQVGWGIREVVEGLS